MIAARMKRWSEEGVSVLIGTVDGEGFPACCRGVAIVPSEDLETATVYFPVATGQETIANIATTRRLAVAMAHPIDHSSTQIKGTSRTVRLARADETDLVRARFERFGALLEEIGLPRKILRTVAWWPAFAVEMQIEQIFDQTPGPKAGVAIR